MASMKYKKEDNSWGIVGRTPKRGAPGKSVELRMENGYVQWRREGDAEWTDLFSVESIGGGSGESGGTGGAVGMRVDGGYIQWRANEISDWVNLIAIAELEGEKGDPGRGVSDIAWNPAENKWVVTYTDGTTQYIEGPDLSRYMPQRVVTEEIPDSQIAEGEIVWFAEAVTE